MNNEQRMVQEFHEFFGLTIGAVPALPSPQDVKLRRALIAEESKEFDEAAEKGDLKEIAKELADILVVVYGAAVTYGIDMEEVFQEVHRSNMSKVWEDGKIHRREDGKILKPPTYSKADVGPILDAQSSKTKTW
jgi:predicted HAD superfamily Cof-like phosphohydrolase